MSANPFATHDLKHLSASQLNLWVNEPALWVAQYLYGNRVPAGAAAARGKAAEAGINAGLFAPEMKVEDCVAWALNVYDTDMALKSDPKREKEREGIPGMVEIGLAELRQYGIPEPVTEDDDQHKIAITLDGIEIPVIGFIDWRWPEHGIVLDLKTTLRVPSEIRVEHARQGAIYSSAHHNWQMRFAYLSPEENSGLQRRKTRWTGWSMCNASPNPSGAFSHSATTETTSQRHAARTTPISIGTACMPAQSASKYSAGRAGLHPSTAGKM